MARLEPKFGRIDAMALTVGLGSILIGLVVMGVLETLAGSDHFAQSINEVGVIIVHVSFRPHLRASLIALGFLILFVWGVSRVLRAILTSDPNTP